MDETCNYNVMHDCFQPRIDGYDYCKEHILEDRTAPFRLCTFTYSTNGRRCVNAIHKKESAGLCEEHARGAQLMRQAASKRHKPPTTAESLLVSLAHYAKIEKKSVNSSIEINANDDSSVLNQSNEDMTLNVDTVESAEEPEIRKPLDPFVDIDAFRVNSAMSRVMDYASESESDLEVTRLRDRGDLSDSGSEIEGIDEKDDVLRHAGIYSAEEVTVITKEKLIRLQSLYIEQFRRLQHTLRERRRTYLQALKKEKETLSSIHNQPRETAKEQKLYDKLKSLNRYHKRNGMESVLHKKALDRRAQATEGINVRPPNSVKCIYTEGGVKCGDKTLPVSKHCKKHILNDANQSLFRPCGCTRGGFECNEPVLNIFENTFCVFHTNIPTVRKTKIEHNKKPVPTATSTIVRPMYPDLAMTEDSTLLIPKHENDGGNSVKDSDDTNDKQSAELLAVLESSDVVSNAEPMDVNEAVVAAVKETTVSDDIIENKLSEMFGDSEATDTASEKEALNTSQNLDDFVNQI